MSVCGFAKNHLWSFPPIIVHISGSLEQLHYTKLHTEMEQKQIIEQFKGQTRLPNFAIPRRYDLHLRLDLSACTFFGTVQINLSIVEETKILVLNALELDVHQVWFTNSHGQVTFLNQWFAWSYLVKLIFHWERFSFFICRSFSPAMLFWMEMMNFFFWCLIKHLVLVREYWGLSFLQSLMRTWRGYINGKKTCIISQIIKH